MFEINYSQLIQYEILEKLVTSMACDANPLCANFSDMLTFIEAVTDH